MDDNSYPIEYAFLLPNGHEETFVLDIDPETVLAETLVDEELPQWTELDFHKCPHCPLSSDEYPRCPLARRLRGLVRRFDHVLSYETLSVRVRTPERTIEMTTSAQRALGSFIGLLNATSGCPHMAVFRPMARFHLSFANSYETLYRAAAMYMLAQYFRARRGEEPDLAMEGLIRIYANVSVVNHHVARRITHAAESDALINGLALLDSFAQLMPLNVKRSLAKLEHLFKEFPGVDSL